MPKVLIMAGGTGGHVFPGLAIAKVLRAQHWTVEWLGTAERMEATTVPQHGIDIHFLKVVGLRGKGLLRKLLAPISVIKSVLMARKILKAVKPDVVVGMGGYASGPGGIAAKLLGLPLVVHEQNAIFGLTNRILAKFANKVLTGFDCSNEPAVSKAPSNAEWIGNPVREEFFLFEGNTAHDATKPATINILITGGSLGALALNKEVPAAINQLSAAFPLAIKHQAGRGKNDDIASLYNKNLQVETLEFIDDTASAFNWADIIICRAGALTVAEVAAVGRCAIFIPLPIAVDDHQTHNARSLADNDAGFIVQQQNLAKDLPSLLERLLQDENLRIHTAKNARALAKPYAAELAANACKTLIGEKSSG